MVGFGWTAGLLRKDTQFLSRDTRVLGKPAVTGMTTPNSTLLKDDPDCGPFVSLVEYSKRCEDDLSGELVRQGLGVCIAQKAHRVRQRVRRWHVVGIVRFR